MHRTFAIETETRVYFIGTEESENPSWKLLAMDIGRQLIILAACFLMWISSGLGQRETFSQRRQRLNEEKRRQQPTLFTNLATTTTTTTLPPRQLTLADRINKAEATLAASANVEYVSKMATLLNWAQFLTPIPSSMGIVATLMMAAGQTDDFPLNERVPTSGGFRYMKHPGSFRRSLMQIGHESYRAFLSAHNNMNKIRLSTSTIPDYIKAAIDMLATGDVRLMRQHLHRPLSVVKKSIDDNVNWSVEVGVAFDRLANLTDEVHLAAVSSNSVKLSRQLQLMANQTTSQLTADLLQQLLDNESKQVTTDLDRYDRNLNDLLGAYLSIPLAIDSLGMNIAQVVLDKVPGYVVKAVKTVTTWKNHFADPPQEGGSHRLKTNSTLPSRDPCIRRYYHPTFTISARSSTLMDDYETLASINSAAKGRYNATKDVAFFKNLLTNTSECRPIREVIERGLETMEQMHQLAFAEKVPKHLLESMADVDQKTTFEAWRISEFTLVRKSMMDFNAAAKYLESVALSVPETEIRAGNVTHPGYKSWEAEQAKANAYYKIALHEETSRVLRSALDSHWKEIIEKTDKSIRILNEIHTWKAEELSLERAVEMLEAGIKEMSQLKLNWALLVRFFIQLSQMIQTIHGNSVEDLLNYLNTVVDTQSFERNNGLLKSWVIDTIRQKTILANQATMLAHGVASTYSRISRRYLMPRVEMLDQMLDFQTRNSTDMFFERNRLLESCTNDALQIQQMIAEERWRLMEKVDDRDRQIRQEYAFLDQLEGSNINNNPKYDQVPDIVVSEFA